MTSFWAEVGLGELARSLAPDFEVVHQGAHLVRAAPGGEELLFLSPKSRFAVGTAIRGGVPVIFPWFGDDAKGRGAHGFARTAMWRLLEEGTDIVRLELTDNARTDALWPHRFRLELRVSVGDSLQLELAIENRDAAPFSFECALHTYLAVGDVAKVALHGFEGAAYLDKVRGFAPDREGSGPLSIHGEVDRIYQDLPGPVRIEDPVLGRDLVVSPSGARSTVLWNPGPSKAMKMPDLEEHWRQFLCVESANVGPSRIELQPGDAHTLAVSIAAQRS